MAVRNVTVDINHAQSIEDLGHKISERVQKFGAEGFDLVSVSHACDPDDPRGRWSVVIVCTAVEP